LKGKAAKRKREEDREKEDRSNHKILNYFNNGPVAAPKPKVCSSVARVLLSLMLPGTNNCRGRSVHGRPARGGRCQHSS
jgi:hypothetical protein